MYAYIYIIYMHIFIYTITCTCRRGGGHTGIQTPDLDPQSSKPSNSPEGG